VEYSFAPKLYFPEEGLEILSPHQEWREGVEYSFAPGTPPHLQPRSPNSMISPTLTVPGLPQEWREGVEYSFAPGRQFAEGELVVLAPRADSETESDSETEFRKPNGSRPQVLALPRSLSLSLCPSLARSLSLPPSIPPAGSLSVRGFGNRQPPGPPPL